TGGELPALVVADAVIRLLPGALGADGAAERESFASGLLEPPQYTRPEEFRGARVPAVLLSGDHPRIARWRRRRWTPPTGAGSSVSSAGRPRRVTRLPDGARRRKGHGCDSTGRGRAAEEGPPGLRPRRPGARAREGHRGREGAHAGLRGHRDPAPRRGRARLVHGAAHLLRRRRRADLSAPLAAHR